MRQAIWSYASHCTWSYVFANALSSGSSHTNRKSRTVGNSELIRPRIGTTAKTMMCRMELQFHVICPGWILNDATQHLVPVPLSHHTDDGPDRPEYDEEEHELDERLRLERVRRHERGRQKER